MMSRRFFIGCLDRENGKQVDANSTYMRAISCLPQPPLFASIPIFSHALTAKRIELRALTRRPFVPVGEGGFGGGVGRLAESISDSRNARQADEIGNLAETIFGIWRVEQIFKTDAYIRCGGIFQPFHHAILEVPNPAIFFKTGETEHPG